MHADWVDSPVPHRRDGSRVPLSGRATGVTESKWRVGDATDTAADGLPSRVAGL